MKIEINDESFNAACRGHVEREINLICTGILQHQMKDIVEARLTALRLTSQTSALDDVINARLKDVVAATIKAQTERFLKDNLTGLIIQSLLGDTRYMVEIIATEVVKKHVVERHLK